MNLDATELINQVSERDIHDLKLLQNLLMKRTIVGSLENLLKGALDPATAADQN